VQAAAAVCRQRPEVGFVQFGEGPLRQTLERDIAAAGLTGRFVLAGFRTDLDAFIPHLDLLVLPSFTEGLPNVVLEAMAAAVPVVAPAVGGTPEVVADGRTGYLVPAGDAAALADRIGRVLDAPDRRGMGLCGQERVRREFTFAAQAQEYQQLFAALA